MKGGGKKGRKVGATLLPAASTQLSTLLVFGCKYLAYILTSLLGVRRLCQVYFVWFVPSILPREKRGRVLSRPTNISSPPPPKKQQFRETTIFRGFFPVRRLEYLVVGQGQSAPVFLEPRKMAPLPQKRPRYEFHPSAPLPRLLLAEKISQKLIYPSSFSPL